jgi:hypothetical protein
MTTVKGAYSGAAIPLGHFNETPVLNLQWIGGNVLVQGRVMITNADGDYQKTQVWLTQGYPPNTIDYVEWMMPGTGGRDNWETGQMFYLSGWAFNLPPNGIIEIRCATFNGNAYNPRLTATLVDDFRTPPPPVPPTPRQFVTRAVPTASPKALHKVIPIMGPGSGNPELERCPPKYHFELTEEEMMQAIKNPDMCAEILGLPPGAIKSVEVSRPLKPRPADDGGPGDAGPTMYCCETCRGDSVCCYNWEV